MTAPHCNICGSEKFGKPEDFKGALCGGCGSSVRFRRVAMAIASRVLGVTSPLPAIDTRPLRGVGLSDFHGYARELARICDYTNTFFHKEPFLDITRPGAPFRELDFLIASDVFEHVPPPVSHAFEGAFEALRPGGTLILSVPTLAGNPSQSLEHFPHAHRFTTVEFDGEWFLLNKTKQGKLEIHGDLRFHGGPGTTLEFRVFSQRHLIDELECAGFADIEIFDAEYAEHLITDVVGASTVLVARKPDC